MKGNYNGMNVNFFVDVNILIMLFICTFLLLEYNLFRIIIDICDRIKGANYNINDLKKRKELLYFTTLVVIFVLLSIQETIRILVLSYSIYTQPPEPIFNSISLIVIYEIIICSLLNLEYVNQDLGFTVKRQ